MVRVNGPGSSRGGCFLLIYTCCYFPLVVQASAPAKNIVPNIVYLDAVVIAYPEPFQEAEWNFLYTTEATATAGSERPNKDSRVLFSPRMDYDEWTPLGRGDPLKNDPTYVYVPPVLEHVHYWVDPSSRTPDPPLPGAITLGQSSLERNTRTHEVAVLRTTRRKPALPPGSTSTAQTAIDREFLRSEPTAEARRDPFDPFLKFIDGPKFSSTPQQHHYHHYRPNNHPGVHSQRNQYMLQTPYYQSTFPSKQRPNFEIQQSFSSEMHSTDHFRPREPYTMLVPPPLQAAPMFRAIDSENSTTAPIPTATSATPSSADIVKVSPVFHSSLLPDWIEGKTQLATLAAASNQITRKVPKPTTEMIPSLQMILPSTTSSFDTQEETMINSPEMRTTTEPNEDSKIDSQKVILPSALEGMGPLLASLLKDDAWTTMSSSVLPSLSVATSTVPSLTTDALFSHYKQPAAPIRGPMYLIIQGHSKVKTYGAGNVQRYKKNHQAQKADEINQIHDEIDRSGRNVNDDEDQVEDEEEYIDDSSLEKVGEGDEYVTLSAVESNSDCIEECFQANDAKLSLKRKKRQLEIIDELLPVEEAAYLLEDFLNEQSEGSGFGGAIANALSVRKSRSTLCTLQVKNC